MLDLMFLTEEKIRDLQLIRDWVMLRKYEWLDHPKEFGALVLPDTMNLNIQESKIGEILKYGPGSVNEKGVFFPTEDFNFAVGDSVYYTRYGKHAFKTMDDDSIIICPAIGIIAKVILDARKLPVDIIPLSDRLWLEELEPEEQVKNGIIHLSQKPKPFKYRPFRVLGAGPGYLHPKSGKFIECLVKKDDIVYSSSENGVRVSWNHDARRRIFYLIPERECILHGRPSDN